MTKATELRHAHSEIEDDLTELHAATGVLHLAFHDMTESGEDNSALAQSIFFTARSIEAIIKRIEAKLCGEATLIEPPCACNEEARHDREGHHPP